MHCELYAAGRCRSCQWLEQPYPQQLENKQQMLQQAFGDKLKSQWLLPHASDEVAFRNKAKMVVSGSVERPIFGIFNRQGEAEDLTSCPLYPASFQPVFTALKPFIARAGLTPYNILRKRGELKYLLLTQSSVDGQFMLRFVLRSTDKLAKLREALPELQQQLPQLRVISVNIQPVHMAILEGEEEIVLSDDDTLPVQLNDVPLFLQPRSFFQTNTKVASALYQTARQWVGELSVRSMWDLFCGVGGFGLHCATPDMSLTGIEISGEAIACATRSASMMGLTQVQFAALDSTSFAQGKASAPDLVLVNPPRRGIGQKLCEKLQQIAPAYLLYSSCNPQTLAADLLHLTDYRVDKIQLFDMFPHTSHGEVLALLTHH